MNIANNEREALEIIESRRSVKRGAPSTKIAIKSAESLYRRADLRFHAKTSAGRVTSVSLFRARAPGD